MGDASRLTVNFMFPRIRAQCSYLYDFGDGWKHTIVLEKILDPVPGERYPICIDGARRCPPEDCGGVGDYANLLEDLPDPDHEEYEDTKTWVGPHFDPEEFCVKRRRAMDRIYANIERVVEEYANGCY